MDSHTVGLMMLLGGIGSVHATSFPRPDHFEPFGLPGNETERFCELFVQR